ncbi:hypothetical protein BAUCODRAFT_30550 [Baudoinia panamericana UAMH 10762]|uniref:SWIM-type domain-containing protein n=1 Tax=Baudoinia panamericana (strain UAMH 10762) TaxID=717646 RepID=M2N7M1_BAUPA|nr:uncharacterized protein BAUCODRAFT_30550 [Baudoinia panamericana UAMH 10762]EMD00094.1 hypothetical protein BAUCODRAFT_30550 [Baudoinia panamericana UAMH 10762]
MGYVAPGSARNNGSKHAEVAEATTLPRPSGSKKRKVGDAGPAFIDLTQDTPPKKRKSHGSAICAGPPKKRSKQSPLKDDDEAPKSKVRKSKDEEKRLRRWRKHAPSSYLEIRDRALTQRMFVLDRQRSTTNSDYPTETISLAGTTGNVYTIVVDQVPSCDCPHARKGNQCKHIAYILSRVLRVPAELEYQLAFTSSELRSIFANAPPLPSETAAASPPEQDGKRKPIEGECPICCVDFEPESSESVVYCKAACGNNIHAECFRQWAATKTGGRGAVTCPFCRTPWEEQGVVGGSAGDEAARKMAREGLMRGEEGYVNVAAQLGMSGRRDYASYHSFWVRAQARRGLIGWEGQGV